MGDPEQTPTAIITGAASGIGYATAERLSGQGWSVILIDLAGDAVHAAAEMLGPSAIPVQCDVAEADDVHDAIMRITTHLPAGLQGLVCAAGIERSTPIAELDPKQWSGILETNLSGQFHFLRYAADALHRGRGSVICVGSPVGRASYPNAAAYAASKAGIEGLVRAAAVEWASRGVRVNCVIPGTTDTPLLHGGATGPDVEDALQATAAMIPMGRIARPNEVAAAISFLLSDEASYVTGASLAVDGGLLAKLGVDS